MTNLSAIITSLKAERSRLDQAITALEGVHNGNGRPTKHRGPLALRGSLDLRRRQMSAAGRARIAAAQKKRWAKLKKATKAR